MIAARIIVITIGYALFHAHTHLFIIQAEHFTRQMRGFLFSILYVLYVPGLDTF
jgi:hypothetical protein